MSILTKVSVVILVVLILVASPVIIKLATVAPNWRERSEKQDIQIALLKLQASNLALALVVAKEERDEFMKKAMVADASKRMRISELRADKESLEVRDSKNKAAVERLTSGLDVQMSIVSDSQKRYDLLLLQAKKYRDQINGINDELAQLNVLLKGSQSRNERAERIINVHLERITELQEKNIELTRENVELKKYKLPDGSGDTGPQTPRELSGTVLAVSGNIVSINVGSAKGVRRGMELIITRGALYLGKLRISEVTAESAAGLVTDNKMDVKAGDKVASGRSGP